MFCTLLAIPLWLTAAVFSPQSDADFDSGLDKLHRLMEQRRWVDADRSLESLLEKFKGQDVAFANRAVLLEDARRIAFWKTADVPEIQNLISGDLQSYKAGDTAKIKIAYSESNLRDFKIGRGKMVHPAHLAGPFTIKLEGSYYPSGRPPAINFGTWGEGEIGYSISFGIAPDGRGSYYPGRIFEYRGENDTTLDERDSVPAKSARPFKLELKVSKSKIDVKQQGKKILSAKRNRDSDYGYFEITGLADAGLSKIELDGEVETSWIDNLIDEAMQDQRQQFDMSYKPSHQLPRWLLEQTDEPKSDPGTNRTVPSPQPVNLHRAWSQCKLAVKKGRIDDAISWLSELEEDDLPESHRAYLLSQMHYRLGHFEEALKQCRLVLEEDSNFLPSRMDEGQLLYSIDREQALQVMAETASFFPNTLAPNREYLDYLMIDGRASDAHGFVDAIAKERPRSPILDALKSILVKAENGPDFHQATE
jgi:tetratricopeptide (TPR) repeat protein